MKQFKNAIGISLLAAATLPAAANSPYIAKVLEFKPAPGQFVNDMPKIAADATAEQVNDIVFKQIGGDKKPGLISLGGYGGYVVFAFDHPVANVSGQPDFKIYGNAFFSDLDNTGGSCEPGIVMVSEDVNGNGIADDTWYEIAGSEYNNKDTFKDFHITYYKPATDHQAVPDENNPSISDKEYIRFTTNQSSLTTGYIQRNAFHSQSYWPEWLGVDELSFEGSRLPDNGTDIGQDGSEYWLLKAYGKGYVDNLPESDDEGIDISWAVDAQGQPIALKKVDFIKVYTAICQNCSWLGETSTEVCGGEDLHPEAEIESGVDTVDADILLSVRSGNGAITVRTNMDDEPFRIISTNGSIVSTGILHSGDNHIDVASPGIFILQVKGKSMKIAM